MIIDTHSHLYLPDFSDDRQEVIRRAKAAGVGLVLLPAIDSAHHSQLTSLASAHPEFFRPMMGLHPCSVKAETWKSELEEAQKLLDIPGCCAIGETGIDLYWDKTTLDIQIKAFETQIEWAKLRNLPVVIHCREAFNEIFEVLDRLHDERLRGVFHCFTGTALQASRIIEYGSFMMGIGGVLTFKNSGLDKVVAEIGLQHLLLETDSPYLAPVPYRGKRNESAYVSAVLKKLAEIKGLPEELVAARTTANAEKMFQLQP